METIKRKEKRNIIILIIIAVLIIIGEMFYYNYFDDIIVKVQLTNKEKNGEISITEELKNNETLMGITDVTGEGIIINIKDGNDLIHQEDIVILLDELKNAGAEAISVNNQRIINSSYIYCDGGVILIDGTKIGNPFTIKAIGNSQTLYGALNRNKGYITTLKNDGIEINIEENKSISILKTKRAILEEYDKLTKPIEKLILSNKIIGKADTKGKGIEIVIDTSGTSDITAVTLLQIINDLNCAGAEAISINEQRVVSMTDIMDISQEYILVNSVCVSSPYTIKAIGNPKVLEEQMKLENSMIYKLVKKSKKVYMNQKNNIEITKYITKKGQDKMIINYMQ